MMETRGVSKKFSVSEISLCVGKEIKANKVHEQLVEMQKTV